MVWIPSFKDDIYQFCSVTITCSQLGTIRENKMRTKRTETRNEARK